MHGRRSNIFRYDNKEQKFDTKVVVIINFK